MFPYVSDNNYLYFASDGHGGYGGLDILRSKISDQDFGTVENVGTPLNTSSDDFAMVLLPDSRSGYFSSNRAGGKGNDDIYYFGRNYQKLFGKVVETYTDEPISGVWVSVTDNNQKSLNLTTDKDGFFEFNASLNSRYVIQASKKGYVQEQSIEITSFNEDGNPDTTSIQLWKHQLFAEGRIFSNETHELLPGTKVIIENVTDGLSDTSVSGPNGKYLFTLRPNKNYQITAHLPAHLPASLKLNTTNMLIDTLKNDFLLEESFIDKATLYFGFDDATVRGEQLKTLDELLKILRNSDDTQIIISAHADAQGSYDYNKKLSEKRALSVVYYLKDKGIDESRIEWYGFGEQLLLNKCSDGAECPEDDHSKNRRAELKIKKVGSSS